MSIFSVLYEKLKAPKATSGKVAYSELQTPKAALDKVSKNIAIINADLRDVESKIAPVAKAIEGTRTEIRDFSVKPLSAAEAAIADTFGTAPPSLEQLQSTLARLEKDHKALLEKEKFLIEQRNSLIPEYNHLRTEVHGSQHGEPGNSELSASRPNSNASLGGSSSSLRNTKRT